ncbi:Clp protease N-terminal domain-containing protein [Streptomyces sp. 5-10]|uniref:Clp protease N-terminal domain-containing protein n=1 Tax=Streptomyces sp. 5-10 TaxID=878925 RepID=UPI001CC2C37A|nr:Clp protease N-terminal domain-containing protein [Streptomyces sp. 5-10]
MPRGTCWGTTVTGAGVRFTGAAARALTAAMEQARREGAAKFSAVHLLRALLEEDNRAVEVLGVCGVPPQAVRVRLDGGTGAKGTTGPLVEILLTEDTRARQLIEALSAVPGD